MNHFLAGMDMGVDYEMCDQMEGEIPMFCEPDIDLSYLSNTGKSESSINKKAKEKIYSPLNNGDKQNYKVKFKKKLIGEELLGLIAVGDHVLGNIVKVPSTSRTEYIETPSSNDQSNNHDYFYEDDIFQCTVCSFRTKSEANCKAHMGTHGPKDYSKEKAFSCPYCEYKCDTQGWLTRHMQTHESGIGSDQGPIYNGQFKQPLPILKKKRKITHKPHKCENCDFRSNNPWNLQLHKVKHHTPKKVKKVQPGDEKPFACSQCDYTCANQSWLNRHIINTHQQSDPSMTTITTFRTTYDCAECNYSCKAASILQQHIAEHRGERVFACNYCEFDTYNREERDIHVMNHKTGGVKPRSCQFCDYTCVRERTLEKHMKVNHKNAVIVQDPPRIQDPL